MYTSNRGRETVCFVIRAVPYKESSLIIDALSMDMGRISFVAKGARNLKSNLKSMLQLFTPLKVTLRGLNNGLKTLVDCSPAGKQITYLPPTLFSALYVNELVYFLYRIEDDSTGVFSAYVEALDNMLDERRVEMTLRNFELTLLEELGVGVDFYHEAGGIACSFLENARDIDAALHGALEAEFQFAEFVAILEHRTHACHLGNIEVI